MNPQLFIAEYLLALAIVVILFLEALLPGQFRKITFIGLGILACIGGFVALCFQGIGISGEAFDGLLVLDPISVALKLMMFFGTAAIFLMVWKSSELEAHHAEISAMLLTILFGCCLMVSGKNLLVLYLGIETASIISYLLSGIKKDDQLSSEASLKYVIYGSLASAVMIFGMSYIYGVTGSLDFNLIHQALLTKSIEPALLWFSLALVFVGFGYKISAAPLHMWAPDVYEGAALPVTAFFSIVPKAAATVALGRFLYGVFSKWDGEAGAFSPLSQLDWGYPLSVIAVVTMFVGNLAALQQRNVKRLLAYSSIAHAGFLVFALSAHDQDGLVAALFYVAIYYLMNLGVFWIAQQVQEETGKDTIDGFRGLGQKNVGLAIAMMIFLVSLTGLPPFAGFISKWYVFAAVIKKGMYGAAVAAVINSVIALFYYAKIIKIMFFERDAELIASNGTATLQVSTASTVFVAALTIPVVTLGLYWEPFYYWIQSAAQLMGM